MEETEAFLTFLRTLDLLSKVICEGLRPVCKNVISSPPSGCDFFSIQVASEESVTGVLDVIYYIKYLDTGRKVTRFI